jgi:hypothetical protein
MADVGYDPVSRVRRRQPGGAREARARASVSDATFTAEVEQSPVKSLGLPISTEMPREVYEFMNLFPQPTRTRPAVEFVPLPYRTGDKPAASR